MPIDPLMSFAADWASLFPKTVLQYLAAAGGVYVIINLGLKARLAERKIRRSSPNREQIRREVLASIRTAGIFAVSAAAVLTLFRAGRLDVYWRPDAFGWWYFAVSVAVLIIAHDAWFYWTHRLLHRPTFFRRFHRLHHQSRNPSPWTVYAFDAGEAAAHAAFLPIALAILPVSVFAVALFLAHMTLRNVIGHSGYELFPARRDGRPLFDWMTSVTHHDLHHEGGGWNFGLYFTWWDRLMGTEHPLYYERFAAAVRRPLDGSAVAALGLSRARS
ncbi:MAG: sterol desaturase family protein [Pseudomonadota bacterium]